MTGVYIKMAPTARRYIGQTVYWDEVGPRHIFLRSGKLEDVLGIQVVIDGDWKLRRRLLNLRSFPMGGEWAKHNGVEDITSG